jgi:hypothetical protein
MLPSLDSGFTMSLCFIVSITRRTGTEDAANEKNMEKIKMQKLKNGECYATVDGLRVSVTVAAS